MATSPSVCPLSPIRRRTLCHHPRVRPGLAERLAKALDLLRDERLDVLISVEIRFPEIQAGHPALLADPQTLFHHIHYRE